jgi:hypothetical protein
MKMIPHASAKSQVTLPGFPDKAARIPPDQPGGSANRQYPNSRTPSLTRLGQLTRINKVITFLMKPERRKLKCLPSAFTPAAQPPNSQQTVRNLT